MIIPVALTWRIKLTLAANGRYKPRKTESLEIRAKREAK
jgi:hypothetical protein